MNEISRELEVALEAAREAGAMLREALHRQDGPRGAGSHAEIDELAERHIRDRLTRAFPDYGYRGEETGWQAPSERQHRIWLVDPNDGTAVYLHGQRGSSVSIALLRDSKPALGVVYAFAAPDDEGDLFAWAEGSGALTRNGTALPAWRQAGPLDSDSIVLVAPAADSYPLENLGCLPPARFRGLPSIAYRLALVAAGDGDACVSLNGPSAWDYAAGHALLRACGG